MRSALIGATAMALALATVVPASGQDTPEYLDPAHLASIDQASVHGTITPPGAELTEKQKELRAYDDLVQGYRDLTAEELTTRYFKDGRFGPVEAARTYSPRSDVTIVRDARWGVPHIYGVTDEGMAFGAGYTNAEDRLPIMELLRALGRGEAFELLGNEPGWIADAELVRLYGYTEDELQAQIDRLPKVYGQAGQDVVDYLDELVAGINDFIVQMQAGHVPAPVGLADLLPPNDVAPWRPTDIVAVVAIIRALFGADGGGELANAARWDELVAAYGEDDARRIYEDFRQRFNDDGPIHALDERFSYMVPAMPMPGTEGNVLGYSSGDSGLQGVLGELAGLVPSSPGAAARDLAALDEAARIHWEDLRITTPAGVVDLSRSAQGSMSNWLAVGAQRSASGHPILLGGPQAGYFDPQILVENELHSPTIHARGAGFPGMGLVVIGRSNQAAWTATAGGSDMIDTYVEVLCDPGGGTPTEDEIHYLYDTDGDGVHECVPMDRRLFKDATTLPGGEVMPEIYAERTIHGPVTARGRIGDLPVAISRKRSTYMKELDAAVSILRMNRGEAATGDDFVRIFGESHNLATNWGYVNDHEIAYFHGGLFPYRPATVHPDLPVWGTGEWEWARDPETGQDRYYPGDDHPHWVNPQRGYGVSWNNRQAPNWGEDDSGWGFSSLYRADLLEDQILAEGEAGRKIDPVRLTQLMEHAGLTDLRGSHVLPYVLRVLEAAPAPSEREQRMVELLRDWIAPEDDYAWGALRRDSDGDGEYEHAAAIAIMDAWWEPLVHAIYDPALGRDVLTVSRNPLHNAPGSGGSAFQTGFYGQVRTDLAMALGDDLRSPTSQVYCGSDAVGVNGTLTACAERLWESLSVAGDTLASDQGSEDPDDWAADAAAERILFLPTAALSMQWVNRPTTQMLVSFGREPTTGPTPSGDPTTAPAPCPSDPLPTTGGGALLVALIAIAGAIGLRHRRRPGILS